MDESIIHPGRAPYLQLFACHNKEPETVAGRKNPKGYGEKKLPAGAGIY